MDYGNGYGTSACNDSSVTYPRGVKTNTTSAISADDFTNASTKLKAMSDAIKKHDGTQVKKSTIFNSLSFFGQDPDSMYPKVRA